MTIGSVTVSLTTRSENQDITETIFKDQFTEQLEKVRKITKIVLNKKRFLLQKDKGRERKHPFIVIIDRSKE